MRVSKIVVFRNDRFGEFLLNIPAFEALKQNYSGAKLTLVVDDSVKELAKRIPFANDVLVWENKKHSLNEIIAFSRKLRREKYDLCVIFNPSQEFNIISFLAGIPVRLGYSRKWGFLLNRTIPDNKAEGSKHEVAYNLELIKRIGIKPLEVSFPLQLLKEDFSDYRMAELGLKDKEFVVIHPWASNKAKEWPQIKFKELISMLAGDFVFKIILIGGLQELHRSESFCQGLPVINLTAKTSLVELAGLLKRTKLLVTNDSGPMHLAAVLGTPLVAIFRKSPASVSARRWGPVGVNAVILENENLSDIKTDEVLDGIKKIIQR